MTSIQAKWLDNPDLKRILGALTAGSNKAYFVGGCVRDALLGRPSSDIDIATDATPQQVIDLVKAAGLRAVPTGIDHGTITVIANHQVAEVTTYRRDIDTDGRRATVAFSDRLEDDAARRDFTLNALYADGAGHVIDPVHGIDDLRAGRIRFIGSPEERIREDYLRILRFFRFHAWYGADGIDADGLAACAANVDGIETLSPERIGQEMLKLLAAPDPAPALASMAACGALIRVLPGADATTMAPLIHVELAAGLDPDPLRRFAILADAEDARRLRLSKKQFRRIAALRDTDTKAGHLGYRYGTGLARDVLAVQAASLGREISTRQLADADAGAKAVFPLRATDLPHLRGKALGKALKDAESRWIDSDFTLARDQLLA